MGRVILLLVLFLFPLPLSAQIKEAEFKGSFYPKEKAELEAQIEAFLRDVKAERIFGEPIGILAPHAGYMYCGATMAYAYRQIQGRTLEAAILTGPSHRYTFQGVAVYKDGAFETPLGRTPVETKTTRQIMERLPFAKDFHLAFEKEHSLEVQLPFLQKVAPGIRIVPLLFGSLSFGQMRQIASVLCEVFKERRALIVASSDMSHYHPEAEARRIDLRTLKMIEEMDAHGLYEAMSRGESELCGPGPVLALLFVTRMLNGGAKILFYDTSARQAGRDSVVGYGAAVFYKERMLTEGQARALLCLARESIEKFLREGSLPAISVEDEALLQRKGVFVTLKKKGTLRGCMGLVLPSLPLYEAVRRGAVLSATEDPRFRPLSLDELKDIRIEISILGPPRRIRDPQDIEVGKDGLFVVKGERLGLLLPQVAREYGLSREQFILETLKKAGLGLAALLEKEAALYAFRAQIVSE
jgi:AmmeMemoRadiSam system protein B/AmmeMemoRadiSam system protein A